MLKGLGAVLATGLPAQIAERTASAPARWQHLALTHDSEKGMSDPEIGRRINQLGADGWELVDVENVLKDGTTTNAVFFFKRPQ